MTPPVHPCIAIESRILRSLMRDDEQRDALDLVLGAVGAAIRDRDRTIRHLRDDVKYLKAEVSGFAKERRETLTAVLVALGMYQDEDGGWR